MALIKCKECGKEYSDTVKQCPHCGYKEKKTGFLGALAIIFVVITLVDIARKTSTNTESNSSSNTPSYKAPDVNWTQTTEFDQMRKTSTTIYTTKSHNTASFKFPYDTPQGSYLEVNIIGKNKAYLEISKGQFMTYDRVVAVKFDDDKIRRYSLSPASSGKSNIVFINDADDFISHMKKSSKLTIEAEFYQDGGYQFEFEIGGFPKG